MLPATDPQLTLQVDDAVHLTIIESRGLQERRLRVGPIGERDARALAAFLLIRSSVPAEDDGPWRGAVAGGTRTVALER